MNCACGHSQNEHGQRMARRGAPRLLPRACRSCACEEFREQPAQKGARMSPDELKKELARRAARIHRIVNDELKEMQSLIDRHAS